MVLVGFYFINEHICIISIVRSIIPVPEIDSGVIKLYPLTLAIDKGVVVPSFRATNVNNKPFESVNDWLLAFRIKKLG